MRIRADTSPGPLLKETRMEFLYYSHKIIHSRRPRLFFSLTTFCCFRVQTVNFFLSFFPPLLYIVGSGNLIFPVLFPIRCFWASRIRIRILWREVLFLPFSHKCVERTVCLWVSYKKKIYKKIIWRKESDPELDPIRIHKSEVPSGDPDQNVTDPQHCI
jgi:hypothetical protein